MDSIKLDDRHILQIVAPDKADKPKEKPLKFLLVILKDGKSHKVSSYSIKDNVVSFEFENPNDIQSKFNLDEINLTEFLNPYKSKLKIQTNKENMDSQKGFVKLPSLVYDNDAIMYDISNQGPDLYSTSPRKKRFFKK